MDTSNLPQADPQVPQTPSLTPQQETREQLYARVYGPGTPVEPAVPAAPPAPVTPAVDPQLAETLSNLQAELAALRAAQAPQQPQTPPAPVEVTPEQKLQWVEKIRQGDFAGAEASMRDSIAAQIKREQLAEIERLRSQSYQDSLQAVQVQMDMREYLNETRRNNPDLVQFERYLNAPVAEAMNAAQAAGKIKTPQDFLREYKTAVTSTLEDFRKLSQAFRAAGKDEALVRERQVLSSQPLTPQQVQSIQAPQPGSQNPSGEGETMQDYFARRRADESRRRGLA